MFLNEKHQFPKKLIYLVYVLFFAGCSSPQDEAKEYFQSGNELYAQEKYVQASLQYRNALQVDNGMTSAWYALALTEEKQGHMDRVYVLLNKVIELEPSHVEARVKRGKILLMGKSIDKALSDSKKLIEIAPDNADVRAFRAAVLLNLSDFSGAVKESQVSLQLDADNVNAYLVLASERLSNNDTDNALRYLEQGIVRNPKNVILRLVRIKAFEQNGDTNAVVKALSKLIKLYPDAVEYQIALARYYAAHQRFEPAIELFRKLVNTNKSDIKLKFEFVRFIKKYQGIDAAIQQMENYVHQQPEVFELKFSLAELYLLNKQPTKAEKIYSEIAANAPQVDISDSAKVKRAALAFSVTNIEKSRRLVDEVLVRDGKNIEALIMKASIEYNQGNIDDSISTLRQVLKLEPKSKDGMYLLAKAYLKNNSFQLARNLFQDLLELNPRNSQILSDYILLLRQLNEKQYAEEVIAKFLEKSPGSILGLKMMALLQIEKSNWSYANELAQRIKELGGEQVSVEQIIGSIYKEKGQQAESIEAFKRAHYASPNTAQPIVELVRSYIRAGKYQKAKSFLDSVLDVNPSNIYASVMMGQWYLLNKDHIKAETWFRKSITHNPDMLLGYIELARFYTNEKKYVEAQKVIEHGLTKFNLQAELMIGKARIYEKQGSIKKAIKTYEQLLKFKPNIDLAANNLASLLSDYDYADEARLRTVKLKISHFKNSPNIYFKDTLGWLQYRLKEYDDAASLFSDALKIETKNPIIHYHLGMTYLAQGKNELAKTALKASRQYSDEAFNNKYKLDALLQNL